MAREFYLRDDQSNKFWTVDIDGETLVTSNGRIGAKPRETRKVFSDAISAQKELEKQVASKLSKGYREGVLASLPEYLPPDWAIMQMDDDTFWRIIGLFNWKKTGDDDAVLEPAVVALAKMSVASIHAFTEILAQKLYSLDTEAHARNIGEDSYRGQGDDLTQFSVGIFSDLFLYARCCVVVNGAAYYESVLADPTQMPQDTEFEALLHLPTNAHERKTEQEIDFLPALSWETFSNRTGWGKTH